MVKIGPLAGVLSFLLFFSFTNLCVGDTSRETVVVFQNSQTDVQSTDDKGKMTITKPHGFHAPAFVAGLYNNKEFFAVFSPALFFNELYEKSYLEAVARTSYGTHSQWSQAKAFTNVYQKTNSHSLWGDITAVPKSNKIYVLATSWDKSKHSDDVAINKVVHDPLMFVGTVMKSTAAKGGDNLFIDWEEGKSLKEKLPTTIREAKGSHFIGSKGNGIVTTNGTILFPIVVLKNDKTISSTLYSIDDGKTWNIGGETESGTNSGSLVEWNDGKLLFSAASDDGYRKVYESNDMGITWKRSPVLFGVWGNNPQSKALQSPGSAIAVSVDGKDVLLFSHPLNKKENDYLDTLQLWLSDGQRIVCIGTISDDEKEQTTAHSLLAFIGEHLYVTHQINPSGFLSNADDSIKDNWGHAIGLTPLPGFLHKVKTKVCEWRHLDKSYESIGIPTNGLVGVLGNTKNEDKEVWADMYNCVNATVKGGKSVDDGFSFDGKAGSGAKWPVQSQGQNQLYVFTENAFTLTATVKIDTTSNDGDIFLIGASANADGKSVLIGLGYKKEKKKWYVMQQSYDKVNNVVEVVLRQEYKVAITFANGEGAVFVDGVYIGKQNMPITSPVSIDHFFIGGNGLSSQAESRNSCTVKNVMLFSRALQQSEIAKFANTKNGEKVESQIETEHDKKVLAQCAVSAKVKSTGTTPNEKIAQSKAGDAVSQKNADGNNSAAVPLFVVACMFFVYLLIEMTVF